MAPRIYDIHTTDGLVDAGKEVAARLLRRAGEMEILRRQNITGAPAQAVVPGAELKDNERPTLVVVVNAAMIAVITLAVLVRLGARYTKTRRIMLDDILIFLAATFTIVLSVIMLAAVKYNLGKHLNPNRDDTKSYNEASSLSELLVSANIAYSCAVSATKLSIIVTILRIFRAKLVRYMLYGTTAVIICLFLSSIPLTLFQCTPVQKVIDPTAPQNQCINFINFMYVSTIIQVSTDLLLVLVPLPYIRKLALPKGQKVALGLVFMVGGIACVASMDRLAVLPGLITSVDITYDIVPTLLWAVGECATGIICVSVPTIWWLLTMSNRSGRETRVFMTSEDDDLYRQSGVWGDSPVPEVSYVTERRAEERESVTSNGSKVTTIQYVTKLKPVAKPPTTWAKGHRPQQRSYGDIGWWD